MNRIPTLDGWRGVAILMVLFDHLTPWTNGKPAHSWMEMGQHGVTIFFVLSGFLITSRLMQERERDGRINLPRFYLRRCRRLTPSAWAYLALVAVPALIFNSGRVTWRELLSCIFFFRNYVAGLDNTSHFWSLSIEEQFYLVWPIMLLLLGSKRIRYFLCFAIFAITAWRLAHWGYYASGGRGVRTEVRLDALLLGCLLALGARGDRIRQLIRVLPKPLLLLLLALSIYRYNGLIPLWECVVIGCLILASLENNWLGHLLSFRPLVILGTVSYSVYIWQQLIAVMVQRDVHRLPYALLLIPITWVSYYYLEAPFLSHKSASLTLGILQQAPADRLHRKIGSTPADGRAAYNSDL